MKRVGEETYFYDMHDGKMLYILTQHSLYSRKTTLIFSADVREELQLAIQIMYANSWLRRSTYVHIFVQNVSGQQKRPR